MGHYTRLSTRKDERLSWPRWMMTHSGQFTHKVITGLSNY